MNESCVAQVLRITVINKLFLPCCRCLVLLILSYFKFTSQLLTHKIRLYRFFKIFLAVLQNEVSKPFYSGGIDLNFFGKIAVFLLFLSFYATPVDNDLFLYMCKPSRLLLPNELSLHLSSGHPTSDVVSAVM